MRRPTRVLGGPGTAGEHGIVPGGTQRAASLPGLGGHGLEEVLEPVEVADPVGREGREVVPEPDERDGHTVRPAVGGQFGGDRREHGGPVGLRTAERDEAGHGLQVEQQPRVVHGAEADEPRVRRGRVGVLVPLGVGAGQHPEGLVLPELPGRRRLAGRLGELEVQVAVAAHPGRVHDGQRPRLGGERGGQSAQRPVQQAYAFGVGADEQRVLRVLGVAGRRRRLHAAPSADAAERRLPQRLPAPAAEGAERPAARRGAARRASGSRRSARPPRGWRRAPGRCWARGRGRDGVGGAGRGPLLGQGDLGVTGALGTASGAGAGSAASCAWSPVCA